MGELRNGLYFFQNSTIILTLTYHKDEVLLWHQRLGHSSFDRLSLISELHLSHFHNNIGCCDACHRAKQIHRPFILSSIETKRDFDLIHYDLWGPCHTPFFYLNHIIFLPLLMTLLEQLGFT